MITKKSEVISQFRAGPLVLHFNKNSRYLDLTFCEGFPYMSSLVRALLKLCKGILGY